jgi:hypothetical protein
MCLWHRDLSFNLTHPGTNWRSGIVRPQIPWGVATGKSFGGSEELHSEQVAAVTGHMANLVRHCPA